MQFLFRTDASTSLGAGHIVRCATLAQGLIAAGHGVRFICRADPGNLIVWLENRGIEVFPLPPALTSEDADADACLEYMQNAALPPIDWLVVDHYHLSATWEKQLAPKTRRILVIDDIARAHAADLLLDQNTLTRDNRYGPENLPPHCSLLRGPLFALVRPEFSALRSTSLARRKGNLDRIVISMGASDPENETAKVLAGIGMCQRPDLHIDIVIGASNPHREHIERAGRSFPNARLHIQTERMAELMAMADCAINAGGSTTWERCTLGLPGIVSISAENQVALAQTVHDAGGHHCLGWSNALHPEDYAQALAELSTERLNSMSVAAARICDGQGVKRVSACLL